jgi:uncharacterized protein (TIGR00290 family)
VNKPKAWLSWSSGKDSAWALHELRRQGEVDVVGLLTTFNETHDRVAMHAVRRQLVKAQAEAAGLPLHTVELVWPSSNESYEARMRGAIDRAVSAGVEVMAFGDLFLEDIRAYRVKMLEGTGIRPIFPLWGRPTATLAREMIAGGLRAHVTCVDPKQVAPAFAGRSFDEALLAELPPTCDPCFERGEMHTFAYAGPMFRAPVAVAVGEIVERGGFVFADLVPATA